MNIIDRVTGYFSSFGGFSGQKHAVSDSAKKPVRPSPGRVATRGSSLRGNPESNTTEDATALLETIITYNPDPSLSMWNYSRMAANGATISVIDPEGGEVNTELTEQLNDRINNALLQDYGGGLPQLLRMLTTTAFTHGATCVELELSRNIKDVFSWIQVDPRRVDFYEDEVGHFRLGAEDNGILKPLSSEQVRYFALDPLVGSPRGRSPLLPLLNSIYFQVEVLKDLKDVAHSQSHPRIHVQVLEDVATQHIPEALKKPGKEDEKAAWLSGWLSDIANEYENMEADDAFFTFDWVEINNLSAGKSTYNISALIDIVEQQVVSALKSTPILLGRTDGAGLAHGTVQWQIFALGISSMQEYLTRVVEWLGNQTLRIEGQPYRCKLEFAEVRTQDRLKKARADMIEKQCDLADLALGVITLEDYSMKWHGHAPAGEPMSVPAIGKAHEEVDEEIAAEETPEVGLELESEEEGVDAEDAGDNEGTE